MKTFTVTELKQKMSDVFNSVQRNGLVLIANRNRPEMVLIDKERLESALLDDSAKSVLIADLTL